MTNGFDDLARGLEGLERLIPAAALEMRKMAVAEAAVDLVNLAPRRTGRTKASTVVYSGDPLFAPAMPGNNFSEPTAATFAAAVAQIDLDRPAGITNAARRKGTPDDSYAVFPLRLGRSPQAPFDVIAAVVGRSNARLPRLWKEAVAKVKAGVGLGLILFSVSAAANAQPTVGAARNYWRAPVANFAALPTTNNVTGDVRRALDSGTAYAWSGSAWVAVPAAIGANSVTLGTHTVGGYAASSTEGGAATTALAFTVDPQNCELPEVALGVAADGSAQCATPSGGGGGGTTILGAYKTATTTRTSNTASLDPELVVNVTAGRAYSLQAELFMYPVFGGIRVTLNGTSTASVVRVRATVATNTQINAQGRITAYGTEIAISPAGNANSEVELSGVVMVSGSGTLGVSWALQNADGNGTQMQSGSVLTLIPLN